MNNILCLETATTVCSVALFENEKLLAFREINEGYRHSEKLTVFIEEILAETKVTVKNLSAVAISNGPGSYTGLRIGMSVAKGICFSSDIPLISISTLEIMAHGVAKEDSPVGMLLCPMIDARRMEVYCGLFDNSLNMIKPVSALVIDGNIFADISNEILFFGDGAAKCREVLPEKFIFIDHINPSASNMGKLAFQKFSKNDFENTSLAEPFYLKEFIPGRKL